MKIKSEHLLLVGAAGVAAWALWPAKKKSPTASMTDGDVTNVKGRVINPDLMTTAERDAMPIGALGAAYAMVPPADTSPRYQSAANPPMISGAYAGPDVDPDSGEYHPITGYVVGPNNDLIAAYH